ncbi:MAG: peptidoglycan DD-metalloendopeptidase family protein [Syntrophomonadaceae bacterium]|nr:peptidoglycan DD-metalloendopeptidase family protein [Syntrophomonadaceae bacterium]MDD3023537.1 peptidoglycan DD-metalloendopeptidase family protein [Syntrophomonadaceae bacterium]
MWKSKKKTNDQLTLILIPATTAKPYSLSIPRKYARGATLAAAMIILAVVLIGVWFFLSRAEIRSVNDLKSDNQKKQETIEKMSQEINRIEEQQKNLIKKQNDIKKQMGLQKESAATPSPSRGGEAVYTHAKQGTQSFSGQTQYIAESLEQQEKEIDELLRKVTKNTEYYRSLPNQWPVYGEISSDYGWRKLTFRRSESFHDGIDIKNDSGTPVMAAADGIVTYAGWKAAYGRTVEIQHSCGLITKYGHNSSLLVAKGDSVKKGKIIAKLGSTGVSTGPHLHFSVLKGDNSQDPMIYLAAQEDQNS